MKRWSGIFRTLLRVLFSYIQAIFRTLCITCICRNLAYSEFLKIQNSSVIALPRIFRALSYLKLDPYLDSSQRFKMEFFAKIVKNYYYFSKELHLRSSTGFWIGLSLNKYSLNSRLTSRYVLYDTFLLYDTVY